MIVPSLIYRTSITGTNSLSLILCHFNLLFCIMLKRVYTNRSSEQWWSELPRPSIFMVINYSYA